MLIYFTDIDNTLVYSHNHKIDEPKVVVEYYNNREQAYMTQKTYEFLKENNLIRTIPVTSRHERQYERLLPFVDGTFGIEKALLCNGGILLENNIRNDEWYRETMELAEESFDIVRQCEYIMRQDLQEEHIHFTEPFFLYGTCDDTGYYEKMLKNCLNLELVNIWQDGRKIYCCAKSITKGSSIKRLLKKEKYVQKIISAGDNIVDSSMLQAADYALAKENLRGTFINDIVYYLEGEMISDTICDILKDILQKLERESECKS